MTREEYTARKEQMLRDKADAKERIGQIQTRGAAWLEPARDLVKRANQAEKLMFSDDLEGIRDFLKIAGSNLRLMPPEKCGEQDNDKARVLPEESLLRQDFGGQADQEARRGGFAARAPLRQDFAGQADLSNPKADAVSVPASKSLQIPANRIRQPALSMPKGFPPSSSADFSPVASGRVARDALSLSKGPRQPLKLLGKSVPVVLMEYVAPWNFIAEFAPRKEWSGRRGSNP